MTGSLRTCGSVCLLLSLLFFSAAVSGRTSVASAQTPVTDTGAYTRIENVGTQVSGVQGTLSETNAGIVTLQQAMATQTAQVASVKADVAALRGVDPVSGLTTGWQTEELRNGLLAATALVFAVVVLLVVRLGVDVAQLVSRWRA